MVSFADYYNAISIDRLPSKTKTGKDSSKRFMKIGLPWKSEFSSAAKTSLLLKAHKKNSSACDWWKYIKYRFKEIVMIFSKSSTTQENITISRKNFFY